MLSSRHSIPVLSPNTKVSWHPSLQTPKQPYLSNFPAPRRIVIRRTIGPEETVYPVNYEQLNNNQWRNNQWRNHQWKIGCHGDPQRVRFSNNGNMQASSINSRSLSTFEHSVPKWSSRSNSFGDIRDIIDENKRNKRQTRCCSPLCTILCVFACLLVLFGIAALLITLLLQSNSTSTTTSTVTTTSVTTTTSTTSSTTTSTTTTGPYCTTRITFDDIPGQSATSGVIPNGYYNLNWTNAQYLNAGTIPASGYPMVLRSGSYVAYNPGGSTVSITTANGTRFAFNSLGIGAAWRDGLVYTLTGYRAGVTTMTGIFPINTGNQSSVSCTICTDYDTLTITASGGTPHAGYAQNGTEVGFDNLCISFGY